MAYPDSGPDAAIKTDYRHSDGDGETSGSGPRMV